MWKVFSDCESVACDSFPECQVHRLDEATEVKIMVLEILPCNLVSDVFVLLSLLQGDSYMYIVYILY